MSGDLLHPIRTFVFSPPLFHPTAKRLYRIVEKVKPNQAAGKLMNTLKQISKECETFQTLVMRPFRFQTSIPPYNPIFTHKLAIDLVWLEGIHTLHSVDTHTRFQSAVNPRSKLNPRTSGSRSSNVGHPFM